MARLSWLYAAGLLVCVLLLGFLLSGCAPSRSYDWGSLAKGVGQVQREARP